MSKPPDYTGVKVGMLTGIRSLGNLRCNRLTWLWLCDCGNEKAVTVNKVRIGTTRSCGCLVGQYRGVKATANGVFQGTYDDGDLTFQQFYELSQLNCYYCSDPPSNCTRGKGKNPSPFTYSGLDRIDSTKPHDLTNVVPCCWPCNQMKKARTQDEFMARIERIYFNKLHRSWQDERNREVVILDPVGTEFEIAS